MLTGDGTPKNKLGNVGDGYIDNSSDDCDYYLKTAKKTWTFSQKLCFDTSDPRGDSFFDVFFDVELYTVDSFFDIFTELQSKTSDNMMQINDNADAIGILQQAFADAALDIQQVIDLLTNTEFGLEEIKTEVKIIETEVQDPNHGLSAIKTAVDEIETGISPATQTQIDNIETETDKIQMLKEDIAALDTGVSNQYVPFIEILTIGGLCDAAGDSDFTKRTISVVSSGTTGTIIVTGAIVVMTSLDDVKTVKISDYAIDGNSLFVADTEAFISSPGSQPAQRGLEMMGQPIIEAQADGTTPHQMTAEEGGATDISFELRCQAKNPIVGTADDIFINKVYISGWKPADSDITISLGDL